MSTYTLFGVEYDDIDDLNEKLAETFWGTFGDNFRTDEVAKRETFNNWTDSLCKGDELCDQGYNDCDLIYTAEDAHARRWL